MSLFASKVAKPPRSGFHWIEGYTVEWEPDDVEEWDSDGEGAWPVTWIRPPELCPAGRLLTPLVPLEALPSTQRSSRLEGPANDESAYYDPIAKHTGLFRNFASLEPTEQSVLRFANRYGMPGPHPHRVIPSDKASEVDEKSLMGGDPMSDHGVVGIYLNSCKDTIASLKSIVALWDVLQSDDINSLAEAIYTSEEGVLWYDYKKLPHSHGSAFRTAITVRRAGASSEKLTHKDIRVLGWMALKRAINEKVAPEYLRGWKRTDLELAGAGNRLSLTVTVHGLEAAMWLQFVLAVAGNKQYEQCVHCQGYFEIGQSAGRKGKQYCSNACKMANYRLRKRNRS